MYSFYYMLLHSIVWHLRDIVHNILNMQRYVTSVAGQTCSFSGKAAKRGSQYLCLNENVSLLRHRHSILVIWHHWCDRQVALGKLAMKVCGLQQDFVTWKIYQKASADMPGQKITFKTKIALKTFGSAMIYFEFERTAETKYQRSQC